jgi:phosphatidylserine decarboxylase
VGTLLRSDDTKMTVRSLIDRIVQQEDLNFLLTNRIPRRALTHFMGWWSRIENPWICRASIAVWRLFSDLDLGEARATRFRSLHECFTRQLKPGARPIEPDPARPSSPCDAIIGACGRIEDGTVLQAKGLSYRLVDLVHDEALVRDYRGGEFITLRLTSSMYHRFHAPADCTVERIDYISGDTWNVNPIALKRIEGLFCRNERAVIRCRLRPQGVLLTLVPVAAVLVASIRLHFVDVRLHLRYRGPNLIRCHAPLAKGEEMGWFEHGSTIVVLVPAGFSRDPAVIEGRHIRMGEALLRAS